MLAWGFVAIGARNLALVLALSVMVATWLLTLSTKRSFTVSGANSGKQKAHVLTLLHDPTAMAQPCFNMDRRIGLLKDPHVGRGAGVARLLAFGMAWSSIDCGRLRHRQGPGRGCQLLWPSCVFFTLVMDLPILAIHFWYPCCCLHGFLADLRNEARVILLVLIISVGQICPRWPVARWFRHHGTQIISVGQICPRWPVERWFRHHGTQFLQGQICPRWPVARWFCHHGTQIISVGQICPRWPVERWFRHHGTQFLQGQICPRWPVARWFRRHGTQFLRAPPRPLEPV